MVEVLIAVIILVYMIWSIVAMTRLGEKMSPEEFPSRKEWFKRSLRICAWLALWVMLWHHLELRRELTGWLFILGFVVTEYLYGRFTRNKDKTKGG